MRRAMTACRDRTFSFVIGGGQFRVMDKSHDCIPVIENLPCQSLEFRMLCGSSQETDLVEADGNRVIRVVYARRGNGVD